MVRRCASGPCSAAVLPAWVNTPRCSRAGANGRLPSTAARPGCEPTGHRLCGRVGCAHSAEPSTRCRRLRFIGTRPTCDAREGCAAVATRTRPAVLRRDSGFVSLRWRGAVATARVAHVWVACVSDRVPLARLEPLGKKKREKGDGAHPCQCAWRCSGQCFKVPIQGWGAQVGFCTLGEPHTKVHGSWASRQWRREAMRSCCRASSRKLPWKPATPLGTEATWATECRRDLREYGIDSSCRVEPGRASNRGTGAAG